MTKKIRVAIIGCGLMARQSHIPNLLQMEEAELVLCCDTDEESLAQCRKLADGVRVCTDYREAINDPGVDAVLLATTERFRLPPVEEAIRANKPVYCEKPFAQNLQEAWRIRDLVEKSALPFCVGHNRRCAPALVDAQRLFAAHMRQPGPCPWRFRRDGALPPRLEEESIFGSLAIHINDDWWSWKPVHVTGQNGEIGLLLSENTHFADVACWFLQSEPVAVTTTFSGLTLHQVAIEFEGGHLATIHSSANGSFAAPKELYIASGRGATVTVDHMLELRVAGIAGTPLIKTYPMVNDRHPQIGTEGGLHGWLKKKEFACEEAALQRNPSLQFTAEPDKGHQKILAEFVREIHKERAPVSPVADAVRALEICVASIRSKREGRRVAISELSHE